MRVDLDLILAIIGAFLVDGGMDRGLDVVADILADVSKCRLPDLLYEHGLWSVYLY